MKGAEKKRSPSIINQTKRFPRSERRDSKLQQESANKNFKSKEIDLVKASLSTKQGTPISTNASKLGKVTSEIYEEIAMHYVEDKLNGRNNDIEKEREGVRGESDLETLNDSVSSQGDESVEIISLVPKMINNNTNLQIKAVQNDTPKKSTKSNGVISRVLAKNLSTDSLNNMKVRPKSVYESSGGIDDKAIEEVKEMDVVEEAMSYGVQIGGSDDETVNIDEKLNHEENATALNKKIEVMERRIEKLEEELREVAALEISLYSVVPEHSNSSNKVHVPARRLSRLYLHACKLWTQEKRATIAKNAVSGLVLIAKSCGNDVPRLSFWLSNTVVLREIVTQAFGSSCQSSSLPRVFESNGIGKKSEGKYSSSPKWKFNSLTRKPNKHGAVELIDDWQETRTFIIALEKIEAWIFSRIVESIWWQTLTPNMQSPAVDMSKSKAIGKLLGPTLGDPKQGSFSVNLWQNAFKDAFVRLCPIRAGGNECGCLPVLARMVMEQCIARLDVAMFNAILRESAHEIPTDPISDPIVDPKVLPIPAGDLSFGSGAQLKNSVGNLSRWLTNLFGTNINGYHKNSSDSDNRNQHSGVAKLKCFNLLNSLSDLLMVPKDMLMDRSIRTEICPSISLPLLKRILCNFTPDEFCPDPVPGTVLEAVNAECIVEGRVKGERVSSFPYTASPITYKPPQSLFTSNTSIHMKGYASDEELEELISPLTSIVEKPSTSSSITRGSRNENGYNGDRREQKTYIAANVRYELLREIWLI